MKKFIALTLIMAVATVLAGCGLTENYAEPTNGYEDWGYETWTEELDLSLVERYEFSIWEENEITQITIDDVADVRKINDFLGNVVIFYRDGMALDSDFDFSARVFATGRMLSFGIERASLSDSFIFIERAYGGTIYFENLSYDDFMDLIISLGG